ncbi:MAG TPA: XdhC family protein [Methylomirabilota bacterium]|nr:XdhC family protein [Methylomirabilota bacterium]
MTLDVLREAARLAERGERVGLATIVATRGSTPQKVGARLLARDDRRLAGTLGGGAVEAEVIREATRAAAGGPSVVREYTLSTGEDEWGLACGGTMVVFVERLDGRALDWLKPVVEAAEGRDPVAVVAVVDGEESGARLVVREREVAGVLPDAALTAAGVKLGRRVLQEEAAALEAVTGGRLYAELFGPPPALVIVGAGHVGKALAALAHGLGVPVTVVDDRPEYASRERFPEADRVVAAPVGEALGWLPIGRRTGVVVAMRNQDLDYEATAGALRTPAGYVGLMGARRKAILVTERLISDGFPIERVRALRAPIGLDIGARAPEEIAVSIMAEWLMVRQGGTGSALRLDEQLFEKAAGRGATT